LFPASDASLSSQKSLPALPAHDDASPLPAATSSLPFLFDVPPSLVVGQLFLPNIHNKQHPHVNIINSSYTNNGASE